MIPISPFESKTSPKQKRFSVDSRAAHRPCSALLGLLETLKQVAQTYRICHAGGFRAYTASCRGELEIAGSTVARIRLPSTAHRNPKEIDCARTARHKAGLLASNILHRIRNLRSDLVRVYFHPQRTDRRGEKTESSCLLRSRVAAIPASQNEKPGSLAYLPKLSSVIGFCM